MFDIVLSAVLIMRIVIADVDYDGSHTYLLEEVRTSGAERPRHIAFTSMDPLPVKEGEIVRMKVDGECTLAYGIDESVKPYWASYRAWICSANILSTQEKQWKATWYNPKESNSVPKTENSLPASIEK